MSTTPSSGTTSVPSKPGLARILRWFPALSLPFALALWLSLSPAPAKNIHITGRYQWVTVGSYLIQSDYWNKEKCPGTEGMNVDDVTGAFSVTQVPPDCPIVSSYPSVLYGEAWSAQSPHSDLPAPLQSLQCVKTSWDFTPTYTGSWDAAYDIWFCPDNSCGVTGFDGGAEMMIWLDYLHTAGGTQDQGPATLEGKTWEVWRWDVSMVGQHWKYIAYLAKGLVHSAANMDLNAFIKDSIVRGYIQPNWYLYAVEAGNEMRDKGVPFTSNHFSVSVNKDRDTKPVYKLVPTFTPTLSPTPDITPIPPPP